MNYLPHFLQTMLRLGTIPHCLSIAFLVLVAAAESRVARCLLATALLCVLAREARAADTRWRNPDGGTFSIGGNWNNGVPGAGDVANFGLSTPDIFGALPPYTVSFTADATNQALDVEDDSVVFDLNGHAYTTTASIPMQLGSVSNGAGRLTVTDGIVILPFQSDLQIATVSGRAGSLSVTTGGLVIGSPDLFVGLNGNGALNIHNNGDLIADNTTLGLNSSATGTATITGGGSSLLAAALVVGSSGTGVLNITDSGRVDSVSGVVGDLASGTGTANVDGAGSRWINTGTLTVGDFGSGTLSITGGGTVQSASGGVGVFLNSSGTVNIDGAGSQWINSGGLSVGSDGAGTLSITAGGAVHNQGSSVGAGGGGGVVSVSGTGSLWDTTSLLVGGLGAGTLSITGGGLVGSSSGGQIGGLSTGHVTVNGAGSRWQIDGPLTIAGASGSNTLEITAGGVVNNFSGRIGSLAPSSGHVTVDGSGSLWHNSELLTIGSRGDGTVEITNGGGVESLGAVVGYEAGSTGLVTVNGAGSLWNNSAGETTIGAEGDAMLLITDGGKVTTGSDASIGKQESSTGTVIVSSTVATADSVWEIGGRLAVGLNFIFGDDGVGTLRIQPGGKVTVAEDTLVSSGDLLSLEGGTLSTTAINFVDGGAVNTNFQWTSGTLQTGFFLGDLVNSAGILAPGNSIGATEIQGNYNQLTNATLEIEIGPLGQSPQHDSVAVTGTATIDGQLVLKLINGAAPLSSQTFIILDAATLIGSFDNIANGQRLATTDGLGSFLVNYGAASAFDPTQVVLSAFAAAIPGDFDSDGDVDGADFVIWQTNFPAASGHVLATGDADGDGDVDGADFVVWQTHFPFSPGPGASPVPEPTAFVLSLAAVTMGCWHRRASSMPSSRRHVKHANNALLC